MPTIKLPMRVEMADGSVHDIVGDQRDLARWEAAEGLSGEHTQVRHLAWTAISRQGLYRQPWERFNNVDCVEVADPRKADEKIGEDEQGLDPGQQTPAATS